MNDIDRLNDTTKAYIDLLIGAYEKTLVTNGYRGLGERSSNPEQGYLHFT